MREKEKERKEKGRKKETHMETDISGMPLGVLGSSRFRGPAKGGRSVTSGCFIGAKTRADRDCVQIWGDKKLRT